ncbi:MAG: hypothetical protein ACI9G1_001456 [Pirellulaceae bacterium]
MAQTVRREWFYRWLQNPSRLQPGTSMPQFFLELKAEERDAKIDQLWSALVNQAKLPLPKGLLDQRAEGSQVVVGDDPVVFRVATKITPKIQIDRAINVGLPGNLNFTFDAATARLRGVWKGKFINAGPAWNGRGGNPVTVIPESIFVTPDHFPLRIGDATAEPAVRFRGYDLVQKYPEFRYTVDGVNVRERIEVTETELIRKYTIENASKTVFFSENENAKGAYSSNVGKFDNGVLKLAPAAQLQFEVRRQLPQSDVAIKETLKWIAAGKETPPKSGNGAATLVLFENKTNQRIKLVWVGYDGKPQTYGQIDAGDSRQQTTYVNNTWLITDQSDKPLGYFIAEANVARAVIGK